MATASKDSREARKWKREIQIAGKREKEYRDCGDKIVKRYRGEEKKRNRYNVLWATTETLRPAIYNSKPNPDVRRRFRDADPLGKAVSEVLERSLFVLFDGNGADGAIRNDLLDSLLPGRGVSVIRYVPKLAPAGSTRPTPAPGKDSDPEDGAATSEPHEADEGEYEEVEDEQVAIEHCDWRDYREGYARTWDEVPWVSFRHKLTREDAKAKFDAKLIVAVEFTQENTNDPKKPTDAQGETAKMAEFWEVWDKLGERVFFVHENVDQLLFPKDSPKGEPPLDFEGFFPCPDPLMLVENTGSRIPIPPFHLYEEQANELDKISQRIDRIVSICRLRGMYDAKLSELPDLLAGDDNELTPVQNAQAWSDGGLDKAIAWMPVDKVQAVLSTLYDAREKQKGIIDELTGVSDIVRGATDPNETATAQQLKGAYHSIRLSRMQQEVQRYARDLLRLAAQVMASRFSVETFQKMTDLKFPTAQDKARMQTQLAVAQQQGQPPDPNLMTALQVPAWEDIMKLMQSPALRQFRIDIETDSTVAAMLNADMQGLSQVLHAITETLTGLAPLVTQGALPIDAAKEIVLAVVRRAKLGTAVEDQLDKLQAPKPQPENQGQAAAAQANAAATVQRTQIQAQSDQQIETMRQQGELQRTQFMEQMKTEREMQREQIANERAAFEQRFDASVKIIIATIQASQAAADREAQAAAQSQYEGAS